MEATASEDAPAVSSDPAARLAAMDPERRAWLEEALDKMSVKTEGRIRQLCHTPLTSGILARICRVRSSKADIFYVRYA